MISTEEPKGNGEAVLQPPERLCTVRCRLGEGPLWDDLLKRLYFVDIDEMRLYSFDWQTKECTYQQFNQKVGCVALCNNGNKLLAMEDGIYKLQPNNIISPINHRKPISGRRFNDGKVGPDNRFYVGTIELSGNGELYCLDQKLKLKSILTGVKASNGLAWSLDKRKLYYCDTLTYCIDVFDFDEERGTISNRKTLLRLIENDGKPDGMTIDSQGMLWIALWGTGRVIRVNPSNSDVIEAVKLPVKSVSSCTFAGDDLKSLIVTSAFKDDISSNLAGSIFSIKTNIAGTKPYRLNDEGNCGTAE